MGRDLTSVLAPGHIPPLFLGTGMSQDPQESCARSHRLGPLKQQLQPFKSSFSEATWASALEIANSSA